ncbi:DUF2079 domain-containing protein [Ferrimicrobium sp.]|uniref:DUF2079 domain-containing protein n=1 Tax=Ferrimicrobium sp. TaxID=2926050 RepID=UPI00262F74D9|nr:DUF2079 domain-containing protein [Ferrimicrobium sp.]
MTTVISEAPPIRSLVGLRNRGARLVRRLGALDGVVKVAWGLGLLQFVILCVEELRIVEGGALSWDYSVDASAYSAIARGDLNPHYFVGIAYSPFMRNHYDLLTWPLALLLVGLLHLPVKITLLILLQALPLALIGPIVATYAWVRGRERGISGARLEVLTLVPALLGLIDIWLYWSASFDYHDKALQGCLLVLAAIALERRRTLWLVVLVTLLLLTGDTGGLVVVGLGIAALLRRRWQVGAVIIVAGGLVLVAPGSILPPDAWGGAAVLYGALAPGHHHLAGIAIGVLHHPARALDRLFRSLPDVWALIGAAGVLGVFSAEGVGQMALVGLAAWLTPVQFAYAGNFQTVPVSDALLLGSVGVLLWLYGPRHRRAVGLTVGIASVVWSTGWVVVFAPRLVGNVVGIAPSAQAGASLATIEAEIPVRQEVVAPNGIIGDFATRHQQFQPLKCRSSTIVPTHGIPLNVVVAPEVGAEYCGPGVLLSEVSMVAQLPGARLQVFSGPVYWVRWNPGPGSRDVQLTPGATGVCGSLAHSLTSRSPLHGTYEGCAESFHGPGFALQDFTVAFPPRTRDEAIVSLSVSGQASLQVWDDPAGALVAQRFLSSASTELITMPFVTPRLTPPSAAFSDGIFPFQTRFVPPIPEDAFELRVFVPKGSAVTLDGVWMGSGREGVAVLRSALFAGIGQG